MYSHHQDDTLWLHNLCLFVLKIYPSAKVKHHCEFPRRKEKKKVCSLLKIDYYEKKRKKKIEMFLTVYLYTKRIQKP